MRERNVIVLVVIDALALLAVRFVEPTFLQGMDDFPEREKVRVAATEPKRDFMFQINGYRTENQGGQKLNMYSTTGTTPASPRATFPTTRT